MVCFRRNALKLVDANAVLAWGSADRNRPVALPARVIYLNTYPVVSGYSLDENVRPAFSPSILHNNFTVANLLEKARVTSLMCLQARPHS
jgi:hypothetical protein